RKRCELRGRSECSRPSFRLTVTGLVLLRTFCLRLNDCERYERRQFEQLQIGFFATGRPDIWKILARDSRIIVVSVSSLHLFEKPLSRRAGYGQFKIMRQAEPARDLHVFEHVFERKVRLKIRLDHLRQFHRQGRGMTGVAAHRLNELLQGQADGLDEGQSSAAAWMLAAVTILVAILTAVACPISPITMISLLLASRIGPASR